MRDRSVKVAGANPLWDRVRCQIRHERSEAWLGDLGDHGLGFDGADQGEGVRAFVRRERVTAARALEFADEEAAMGRWDALKGLEVRVVKNAEESVLV